MGNPNPVPFPFDIGVGRFRHGAPQDITVPADPHDGQPGHLFYQVRIAAVVAAMDPSFHRRRRRQHFAEGLQVSVGIADNSDFHHGFLIYSLIFFQFARSFLIALPRWLMRFFSSAVASPNPLCSSVDQNRGS